MGPIDDDQVFLALYLFKVYEPGMVWGFDLGYSPGQSTTPMVTIFKTLPLSWWPDLRHLN